MADTTNPLYEAYKAVWDVLEAREEVTDLILRPGQRIKFHTTTNRDPWQRVSSTAMFPAVAVIPVQGFSHMSADSCSIRFRKGFGIVIAEGDQRLAGYCALQFAILRAMANWESVMSVPTWQGSRYIMDCSPYDQTESVDKELANRGIKGWSAAWAGELDMYFQIAGVKA